MVGANKTEEEVDQKSRSMKCAVLEFVESVELIQIRSLECESYRARVIWSLLKLTV